MIAGIPSHTVCQDDSNFIKSSAGWIKNLKTAPVLAGNPFKLQVRYINNYYGREDTHWIQYILRRLRVSSVKNFEKTLAMYRHLLRFLRTKIFFWTIVRLSRPSHFLYRNILLSSKERYDFHLHFFPPAFKNMRQWPRVSHSSWLTRSLTLKPDISRTTGSCQWQKFRNARHTGKACQCQWIPRHFSRKVEQGKPEPSLVGSRYLSPRW